jgi:hypothetical protein
MFEAYISFPKHHSLCVNKKVVFVQSIIEALQGILNTIFLNHLIYGLTKNISLSRVSQVFKPRLNFDIFPNFHYSFSKVDRH